MLRSVVDVQGAKNGMYAQLGNIQQKVNSLSTTVTSAEVPITLEDYEMAPNEYPSLLALQYKVNQITEEDCLKSGYTKVVLSTSTEVSSSVKDLFQNPEDKYDIAKLAENVMSMTIKPMWAAMQPPIGMVAGIVNVGPIEQMVKSAIEAIEGIVKVAETPMPEKQLDMKVAEQQTKAAALVDEAQKAQSTVVTTTMPAQQLAQKAKDDAKKVQEDLDKQAKAIQDSSKDAFAKMQMPPMPDGIDQSLDDMYKAVTSIATNIQNVFIVILFKLIECIFKCFNQIIGIIGVPTLPYPLNIIPQLVQQVDSIIAFTMGLPMSLMKPTEAVVKQKVKATVVADAPTPPTPVPTVTNVPPTTLDVPKIGVTWLDVQEALETKWKFSSRDADDIVELIQDFFDGDDVDEDNANLATNVLVEIATVPSKREGYTDRVWVKDKIKRIQLKPKQTLNEWLPQHIQTAKSSNASTLSVPKNHVALPMLFSKWEQNRIGKWNKVAIPDPFEWEMKTFTSK